MRAMSNGMAGNDEPEDGEGQDATCSTNQATAGLEHEHRDAKSDCDHRKQLMRALVLAERTILRCES